MFELSLVLDAENGYMRISVPGVHIVIETDKETGVSTVSGYAVSRKSKQVDEFDTFQDAVASVLDIVDKYMKLCSSILDLAAGR